MEFLIDDANPQIIAQLWDYYPVDGVTTNPSILAKYNQPPFKILKEIRSIIGEEAQLHVQVIAKDAPGIIEDAKHIVNTLPGNTFVKIPAVPEGFKAMKQLHREGISITATAIYTPMQAFLADKCGASYAAPYVNRIDNMGYDGVATTCTIQDIFTKQQLSTKVLAASFKNSQQVLTLCKYGIQAATLAPDVVKNLVNNLAIDGAVEAFCQDFAQLVGPNLTMKDLK